MMDISRVQVSDLTENDVNAHDYASYFLENEKKLADCGIPRRPIGEIATKCNCGATPVNVEYDGIGQGLIRTSDVRPNRFDAAKVLRTKSLKVQRDGATAAVTDDLVFTMSGSIGYAAVIEVPRFSSHVQQTIGGMIRKGITLGELVDPICRAAKMLVEALIERRVTEKELEDAQRALESGNRDLGREILARMTRKGLDVAGEPPLFPDLDALYAAIDEANAPAAEGGDG
ncbi:MAG: hypothetical protein ACC645_05905 [Pirellulales bacterium]